MNFAYIDPRSLLESVFASPPERIEGIPWDIPENWKAFEAELNNFKTEFTKTRTELGRVQAELSSRREEINCLRIMMDAVSSEGLKGRLTSLIDNYESEEGISVLTRQCRELTGKVEAMKNVLVDTGCDRYGKFTCFVCMDRLVDLFIDPCGHVMCGACWFQTRDKTQCPGCRTPIAGARKIFNL